MGTKDAIAQEIITHEAIYKVAKLLDQFCDGLQAVHLLALIRAFPAVFSQLFTFTGDIDASEVVDGLYAETQLTAENEIIMGFLRKFILQSSKEGNILLVYWFMAWG